MARKRGKQKDVGDDLQVVKNQEKQKLIREREVEEFRQILDTPGGRAFVWRALGECGIFHQSFGNGNDNTNFNEGKRKVGLWLYKEIFTSNPDAFILMTNEASARDNSET